MTEPLSFPDPASAPLGRRLLRLAVALAVLWLVMFVLAPLPLKHIDTFRQVTDAAEEIGVAPGMLYYSDLPISLDAERNSRSAIRRAAAP